MDASSSPLVECAADVGDAAGASSSSLPSWARLRDKPDLPVLPDVTQKVMRLANDPTASLNDIATLLSRDAATAAHVLRLANSPLYRGREPIVTLQQAAARLGAKNLRDIAVVVACESRLFRARGFEHEARHAFTHGFLTGLWAQEIARRQRGPVEEAFLCGLLHDVGTPLLLQAACDALPDARERRDDVLAIVDAAHAAAGAELCRRWGMQERIASVLEFHHVASSGGSGGDMLRDIVVLANVIADACDDGIEDAALVEHVLAHPAAAALNLYDEDVVALLARKATLLATAGALH